jgi:hypothetical protein
MKIAYLYIAAALALLLSGFALGRWTAPTTTARYTTTSAGWSTTAYVTDTQTGKVWPVNLREIEKAGRQWTPPQDTVVSKPWYAGILSQDTMTLCVFVVLAGAIGWVCIWYAVRGRKPPTSAL